MLKNRYQEVMIGLNHLSLIRGLIAQKRGHSSLLIDDHRFKDESYHTTTLSELEVLALLRLGNKYEIPELSSVRQFLLPATINIRTDRTWLQLGQSPFENLRELLRKYPEIIAATDLDEFYAFGAKEFDALFLSEIARYEEQLHDVAQRPKGFKFELQGPKWLKSLSVKFGELINREYTHGHDLKFAGLLHLLGITFEEKLKTKLSSSEIIFYFLRLLAPVWRLQDFFLTTQLKRRLLLAGGDYKESTVQFWQIYENKFENLLLASFEGVISGDRVLFFSHLPVDVPFTVSSPYPFYRKAQLGFSKKVSVPFPPTQITLVTELENLGSERPYRAWAQDKEISYYHFPYLAMAGSKSEFYDRPMQKSFESDVQKSATPHQVLKPQQSQGVCLDLRALRGPFKSDGVILDKLPLKITTSLDQAISGFEYWGPLRYRSLGLLALCYGIEGI